MRAAPLHASTPAVALQGRTWFSRKFAYYRGPYRKSTHNTHTRSPYPQQQNVSRIAFASAQNSQRMIWGEAARDKIGNSRGQIASKVMKQTQRGGSNIIAFHFSSWLSARRSHKIDGDASHFPSPHRTFLSANLIFGNDGSSQMLSLAQKFCLRPNFHSK